jgi:hypothetical protein
LFSIKEVYIINYLLILSVIKRTNIKGRKMNRKNEEKSRVELKES